MYHTSTLPLFAALRRKISRDDLLKALRPIAEAHQPDNAADNGPWPRRCTPELFKDIRLLKSKFLEHREALVFHFDRVEMQ